MLTDFLLSLRLLRRSPGFALVAIVTLALGIGATTAVFSVVDTIVLRPLPYADPERLVSVISTRQGQDSAVSPPDFLDWQAQAQSFEYLAVYGDAGLTVTGTGEPEMVQGMRVSWTFLPALGVEPVLGRGFRADDDRDGAPRVALLSHAYWQRRFGGEPGAVGRTLTLNQQPSTIVGVLPQRFTFAPIQADILIPAAFDAEELSQRGAHFLDVIGRLKEGISPDAADAEMRVIARRLEEQYPETNPARSARVEPLHEYLAGPVRRGLLILLAAVSVVLLIACANVANLLLARNTARAHELAVRTALGASRWRLVRQLAAEALVLALGGAAAGVLLAWWSLDLLLTWGPPRLDEVGIDARVLAFAAGAGILSGLLAGIAPMLRVARHGPGDSLRDQGRASTTGPAGLRLRRLLTAGEVALALVLLAAAGLLLQSFVRIQQVNPGFVPDRLLTGRLELPGLRYAGERDWLDFYRRLQRELASLPAQASLIEPLPMSGSVMRVAVTPLGRPPAPDQPAAHFRIVGSSYFETMRVPLRAGRTFSDRDDASAPNVLVVNETMARQLWPGENPIGRQVQIGWDNLICDVVGIVGDVRHQAPHREPGPEMYVPFAQISLPAFHLVLRPSGPATDLGADLRTIVRRLDPALALHDLRTMPERLTEATTQPRFYTTFLGVSALVAVALAAIGLYGLVAFSVARQTREIGVRLALGAAPGEIHRLVISDGMRPVVVGVVAGAAAAVATSRVLESLLFETDPADWRILAAVALLLALTGMAAAFLPARRAAGVDPAITLRAE